MTNHSPQHRSLLRKARRAVSRMLMAPTLFLCLFLSSGFSDVYAFAPETYAEKSVLAEGDWIKIQIEESGLYRIPNATLRRWGFSDPSKVRIYGRGGAKLPDLLSQENFFDDLKPVAVKNDGSGVVFYAHGPETVTGYGSGYLSAQCNIYSSYGYYFVTASDEAQPEQTKVYTPGATGNAAQTFTELSRHERDLTAPGECGPNLLGEEFRYTPSRRFAMEMPGVVEGSEVKLECYFAAKTYNYASEIGLYVNGSELPLTASQTISATGGSSTMWAQATQARNTFTAEGEKTEIGIEFRASSVVYGAWLDYLALSYERRLELPQSTQTLCFSSDARSLSLGMGGDANDLNIWDVTDPTRYLAVDFGIEGDRAAWSGVSAVTGNAPRRYAAWTDRAKLPEPRMVSAVTNQNLHGLREVDMVIISPASYVKEARKIAAIHTAEGLNTEVVDVEKIYNEFSSGTPDICGIRNFLKMLYDRGEGSEHRLKYVLLTARTSYDIRRLAQETASNRFPVLPAWYDGSRRTSLSPTDSFGTDDFISMLEDNAGTELSRDRLCVAVGRIPVTSTAELRSYIDKLKAYRTSTRKTAWKNRVMLLADDEQGGDFAHDMENFTKGMNDNASRQYVFQKVYMDAYEFTGGEYPGARRDMFRNLNEGVAWWIFSGHANDHSMTAEKQLTYDDINNRMYLRNYPFLLAATCNFLKWDGSNESAGEMLVNERNGGLIGVISATREAYIPSNSMLVAAFGRALDNRDENGRLITAGEAYRRAKNDIRDKDGVLISNANKLRYVFMGDPAMTPITPSCRISVDSIAGKATGGDEAPQLAARQKARISGRVLDIDGLTDESFNGTLSIDIYDSEKSMNTRGRGDGEVINFETHGDKIYSGATTVTNGRYSVEVAMPEEIADNYRPALINLYACSSDAVPKEAISAFSDFYVAGYDDTEAPDTEAPKIEFLVLNHESFAEGGTVNTAPMVLARVTDNVGINISSTGMGRAMNLLVDGKKSVTDVNFYYTPLSDGTAGGEIAYPLDELREGDHSLRFRVWDTSGNMAEREISFRVKDGLAPEVFDVYADSNPAHEQTNFFVRHNQPDCMATVTVTVYNLLGRPVWSGSMKGRSDMFLSTPVNWDLCDSNGRRVPRGIYVYTATITTDGGLSHKSASHKIAVSSY